MYKLLVATTILGFFNVAFAGPPEGELFGYRLGSKYSVTDNTRGYFFAIMGSIVVIADKPEKSDDFQRVELITTPKTFTIVNIYGIAEVGSEKEAKDLTTRYADLLKTLHGNKCLPEKAHLGEVLKLLCSGKYELKVSHYSPGKIGKKHKVHVGLNFSDESEAGKKLLAQFKKELNQLETEGKMHRLEQAKKEQKLRGLQ